MLMKKWKIASLFLMLAMSAVAHANGAVQGTVSMLIQRASDGLIYVIVNGTRSGAPGCATAHYWVIANENSEAGKRQFAMLMTAYASGGTVLLNGTGTCTRWLDAEDINEVRLIS